MRLLRNIIAVCGLLLLSGCATEQPYLATHTNTNELAQIRTLHVISVIPQDKLEAQHNNLYVNTVPLGAAPAAAIIGGALGSALVMAEADHEAKVFADTHLMPLLKTLAGHDSRATLRQSLQQALTTVPVRLATWQAIDHKTKDVSLLPAQASAGSAWLILHTRYSMTPDFAGLQVITQASLYVDGQSGEWRVTPAYKNKLVYQSPLRHMPAKTDVVRKHMADAENARYAKLDVGAQIAKANANTPYDQANATLRRKIQDEQWQHAAALKQIASPYWSPDERATRFVHEWQEGAAQALQADLAEGGVQTAHMLTHDLSQATPDLKAKTHRDWVTVYHDAQRTTQDAPDGTVYSVANGDVTHGAQTAATTVYISAPAATR